MLDNRNIRVFISSTFRDMMRERDLLVKQVFPNLRRLCAKRFVTFTEVDLRWGITEEQASEGQVLPLCLAEIERSRPFFIGLLGERYGWVPDTIRPEVIGREPWLKEHLEGHTSVTELEILHGVLNNPKMRRHAFFYFRDPAYENDPSLGEDDRRELVERNIKAEAEKYGEEEATRRTEQRKAKLAALKERIRKSGLPMVEPYANPEVLAKIIEEQFTALIDQLYPKTATPDSLAQERTQHEAHARNKLFACIDPSFLVPSGRRVAQPLKEPLLLAAALLADRLGRLHQGSAHRFQPGIARQTHDVIDPVALAPLQHPPPAKARVRPQDDPHLGPRRPQPRDQELQDRPRMPGRIDVTRAQVRDQELLPAEDVERQETVMSIVPVEEPALLIAMDPVISRVEVQHQFLRPALAEGGDKLLDQHPVDGRRRGAVCLPLQPAKSGAAGQRLAPLHRRLPRQIMAQRVVIVEILVPQGQTVDALPQQIGQGMGDQRRIAPIPQHLRHGPGQSHPAVRLPQEHHPAIAGDIAARETPLDFAAIKAWKTKRKLCTI